MCNPLSLPLRSFVTAGDFERTPASVPLLVIPHEEKNEGENEDVL